MPLGDLDLTWRTVRKGDFNVPGVRLRLEKDLSYHAAYLGRFGVFAKGISVRNTAQSLAALHKVSGAYAAGMSGKPVTAGSHPSPKSRPKKGAGLVMDYQITGKRKVLGPIELGHRTPNGEEPRAWVPGKFAMNNAYRRFA